MKIHDGTKLLVQFYANHGELQKVEEVSAVPILRLKSWLDGESELSAEDRSAIEQRINENNSIDSANLTVGGLMLWLSMLDQRQQVWIYDHKLQREIPFDPVKHIDHDRQWFGGLFKAPVRRIVIDR